VNAFLALHQFSIDTHAAMGFHANMRVLPPFVSRAQNSAAAGHDVSRYFLFVGRLESIKGAHTLLPLFQGPGSSELWIAGDGSRRTALERQAAGHQRIRFLGHVSEPRLSDLYRSAIALIVPSLTYEVFPLVILEAFRQGTPILVPRFGAMPDIVESSHAGFAYGSAEELVTHMGQLENDPVLRNELGIRALAALEQHWTPEAHLKQYFSVIREVSQSPELRREPNLSAHAGSGI
jgi:glycosyltransferase involved in cell wall biosynthesis